MALIGKGGAVPLSSPGVAPASGGHSSGSGTKDPAAVVFEAVMAFAVVGAILFGIGDTRLYPVAFGIVSIALLYNLLTDPGPLTTTVKWATSHI